MRGAMLVMVVCGSLATTAHAQEARPGYEFIDFTSPEPIGAELTDVRLSHHVERREAGLVLAIAGLASAIGGGVTAAVLNEDPFWLAFGLGHVGWGAINAALAIGMLDFGDGGARAIEDERNLHGEDLLRARERALRSQHDTATLFAVNFGIDFFYIASGVLLFFLADQIDGQREQELLRGYSVAMAGQGTFLLGFDLVEWITSAGRAERIARIPFPR